LNNGKTAQELAMNEGFEDNAEKESANEEKNDESLK